MKKLFEFECDQCGIFEDLVDYTKEHDCPSCGKIAYKIISTPSIQLEGWSGAFPGAHAKWERNHWQDSRQKTKKEDKD
tara:strand:- start:1063 stop:1296 length:234 start_codon:yes stop_codon:yes gene_type:complete